MAFLLYAVLRLLAFGIPFVVIYWLGGGLWLSLGLAALIGVMLSYLLLHRLRSRALEQFGARVHARDAGAPGADDEDMHAEDAVIDRAGQADEPGQPSRDR
ncbi:DUF4229 domain-containing protein [Micrococcales bacterium 31B]|nr:DUF4229 domain-containing protein [Micrococcales bacterium 31B]